MPSTLSLPSTFGSFALASVASFSVRGSSCADQAAFLAYMAFSACLLGETVTLSQEFQPKSQERALIGWAWVISSPLETGH